MLNERWQTLATDSTAATSSASEDGRPMAARIDALRPLCFQGPDVLSFLQGYLTIDLDQLVEGEPRLAALTNLKGRVVATGWCQLQDDRRVDWLIHRDLIEPVREFLARYLAFSKTELVEPENDCIIVGLVDSQNAPSARLICSETELERLATSHRLVEATHWYAACIDRGVVLIAAETTEAHLPQMIGLVEAGAVDFDKGCYLGQEVVARAQHRGEVKRRLIRLTGAGEKITPGSPLTDTEGKEQGSVLMCEPPVCLAVVRQPEAEAYRTGGERLTKIPS